MLATLESWGLDQGKQICLITDSGANIISAASQLNWQSLSCFGHNLHLAITKALKHDDRCTRVFGLARKIVSAFSMSWKKRHDLAKAQREHNLPLHSLIADGPTRWGSSHKMLLRILEQESAISAVLSADRKCSHLIPTWQDTEVLEAIDKALTPMANLTDLLSGEKYISISAIKPVLSHISTEALAESNDNTTLTKDIKRHVLTDIESWYLDQDVDELLNTTSFLDPRFKMEHGCKENVASLKGKIQDEGVEMAEHEPPDPTTSEHGVGEPPSKKRTLASILRKKTDEVTTVSMSPTDQVKKEIECYLSAPNLDAEGNLLLWWKVEGVHYPMLSKLASKYLAVCATRSPSERVFSSFGKTVTPL